MPVAVYRIGEGIEARLGADGQVIVMVGEQGVWAPLLQAGWPPVADPRSVLPAPFTATAREGDCGGRRGFSRDADDDGDGLVDEDPLDGRDNDGDGLVDEDYAAISHLMGVWDQSCGASGRRVETYHWTYHHLSAILVAGFSRHGDGIDENLWFALATPGTWLTVEEVCSCSPQTESRAPQFVARVADPRDSDAHLWVGVGLLDHEPRQSAHCRIRLEQGTLIAPPLGEQQAVVVTVGATRLQVLDDLRAAIGLQDGVEDPVSGQHVRWLPPAKPQELLPDLVPAALLQSAGPDGFSLVFPISAEHYRRWDPDLFRLDGRALGPAARLVWIAESGGPQTIEWHGGRQEAVANCRPYAALGASGAGTLEIHFAGPPPGAGTRLEAVLADGRRGECALTIDIAPPQDPVAEWPPVAGENRRRLQLSPALLVPSPNPFHTATRISFQVPATYAEAFDGDDARELQADPQQRMPYAGGAASVLVTVYSLEGRELATLFAGLAGVGTYETHWDGRDREGRPLASGTYFCKLQVDQWSVTKRIIFIR